MPSGSRFGAQRNTQTRCDRRVALASQARRAPLLPERASPRFFANNPNPDAYYEPNSFDGPVERPDLAEPPLKITGDADRFKHHEGNDDYGQPRALFNLFDDGQKVRLYSNIAALMQGVPDCIVERQLSHFEQVHPNYAAGVRAALAEKAGAVRTAE